MLDRPFEHVAKALMKAFPAEPAEDDLGLWEIFRQERYTAASPAEQDRIKLRSARFRYDEEARGSYLDRHFSSVAPDEYRGASVLDLGCFTGGRLLCWAERYGFGRAAGVDRLPLFIEAGELLARELGIDADLRAGVAEALPFEDEAFDFVVSTDVLEHVQDVARSVDEVWRVLKPGGRFLVAFPQYLQPFEAHLGLVTRLHGLHWVLPGRAIARAAHDIVEERGPDARWYAFESRDLEPWERLPSLNGMSARGFRRILRAHPWVELHRDTRPFKLAQPKPGHPIYNALHTLVSAAARTPLLEELLLARVRLVLQKSV